MKTQMIAASALLAALATPLAAFAAPAAGAQFPGREVLRHRQGRPERLPDRHPFLRRHLDQGHGSGAPGSTCRPAPAPRSPAAISSRPDPQASDGPESAMTQSRSPKHRARPASACAARIWRRSWRRLRPSASSKSIPRTTWAAGRRSPLWSGSAATGRSACMASAYLWAAPTASTPAISRGWRRWSSAWSPPWSPSICPGASSRAIYLNDLLPLPYTEEALD